MEHIVLSCMIFGLVLVSCKARTTFAQNSTGSSKELCLPGNIYNNNLTLTGSNGTLRSPPEGSSYHPDLLCNWLITVPEGNIVKLTFDKFDLEYSYGCFRDYVEVFDGKTDSYSESKGKFCGAKYRRSFRERVRSSSRYMLVRFRSDWFIDGYSRGFEATFTAENEAICPHNALVVSASASYEKTLTSPNYPSHPDNDRNCNWLLEVDSGVPSDGYIVKVTFNGFSLECDDELKFYDGNSTGSNLLGSYCGSTPPEVIYSTGRYLYVNFRTDDFYALKGFNLSFSAVKEEEASAICRPWDSSNKVHSLSGTSGTFFSPDFPYDYPDDVQCIWTVSVPAGKVVKLTFQKFKLELDPEDCKLSYYKDYVEVRDGQVPNGKELAVYCGYYFRMGPSDVYSTGNYMSVIFRAILDGKQSSGGFKARFEAVDPQSATSDHLCFSGNVNNNNLKITASHGTLQSPLRGTVYPPDVSCDWLITVPEGKTVKLSFDAFDLQSGYSQCTADYVEILDGKYNNSESKGKFCDFRPEDVRSSGRYMRVRFKSDSETTYYAYSGFKASFIAEDKPTEHAVRAPSMEVCFPGNINNNNLKLIGSHGTLQSPEKDSTYPPDSSCDWLITVPDGKIVKLSFEMFDLERSIGSTCTADYVEVLDGSHINSESKGRFCGSTAPSDITSSGRYMWVAFRSDSQHSNYLGFQATFTAEDKSSFGTVIIVIVVSLAVLVLLAFCVVCAIKRRKKPDSDADLGIPMTTATNSASHTTRPGEVQHSRHPSRQAPEPTELVLNIHPLPPVGYAPVPTNPEVPPPAYPYPLESPPPYPGKEAVPQYPPPGEPYPWQQTRSSAPVEPSAPTEGLVEPSAPPVSP